MKVVMARVGLLLTALGLPVRAEVLTVTSPVRAKMPEPLLTESITDLDGARAGEVEVDVNGLVLRRTSAVRQWQTSVEVEWRALERLGLALDLGVGRVLDGRSEEHTSELQSLAYLVCRLLLEKKKNKNKYL